MLTRRECRVRSINTFVPLKCNIDIDLDFHVRVRTCVKRVTGKQPSELRHEQQLHTLHFLIYIYVLIFKSEEKNQRRGQINNTRKKHEIRHDWFLAFQQRDNRVHALFTCVIRASLQNMMA